MMNLDRKLLRDLVHLRGQAIAVALVVACGIASYVSMRTTYRSLLVSQATYYRTYRFADVFAQLERAPEAVAAEIRRIPGVASVETRVVMEVTLDVPGLDEPATARLVSVPERPRPMLNDLHLRRGRYIEPGAENEVIASEAFAEANRLAPGDTLTAVLHGRWKKLRIVGVALSPEYIYEVRGGGNFFPDNRRFGVLWMSEKALAPAFDMEGAFNDVAVALAPRASEKEVVARLDRVLARYGSLGAYGREDQLSHTFISDEIEQNRVTSNIVPSIFLGVAAFLVHIVLSRLVSLQRAEIGTLKAFGYSNPALGLHFLQFAMAPVIAGAVLGSALGLYFGSRLTEVYALFYRFPVLRYEASPAVLVTAIAVSAAAAAVGALNAVRATIALPPAEAMRPEPPARFRTGVVERTGLFRKLSPAARIVARNLARRPVKALFSTLGIALAVAVLAVGLYFYDAMEHIVRVQFRLAQRDHATVTFDQPRSAEVQYELAHLPGVLRAEPFRMVAARLRFAHRQHRTALLGLQRDADLRRLVDAQERVRPLPPTGVVLTTKLAEMLGVHVGDLLTVEVLEGARPVRQVVVSGLVEELIGVSAYMDASALHRLMREGATASGAFLAVDERAAPRLYSQLKQTPGVSGVAIREAQLESFDQTIAKSLAISTGILVAFACVIAAGLVYNGARIALSERGRELASLRILGFTREEIAFMLLAEQALLTLVATPLGWLIGYAACALVSQAVQSELYRLPLVVNRQTYVFAFLVVLVAAAVSGMLVWRRVQRLDLVAVLKTRE